MGKKYDLANFLPKRRKEVEKTFLVVFLREKNREKKREKMRKKRERTEKNPRINTEAADEGGGTNFVDFMVGRDELRIARSTGASHTRRRTLAWMRGAEAGAATGGMNLEENFVLSQK